MHLKIDRHKNFHKINDFGSFTEKSSKFGFSWLDSSMIIGDKGKNSFMMSDPIADIYELNNKVYIDQFSDKFDAVSSDANIFDLAQQLVHQYDLCAVGYISYESTLDKFGIVNKQNNEIPSTRFLLYENLSQFSLNEQHSKNLGLNTTNFQAKTTELISKDEYLNKVLIIKNHIKEGDIYQANFTTRFKVSSPLSPFVSYMRLREFNPSPYSAYLNFGDYQILSSSPERMFIIEDNKIKTCPIKGTIKLGIDKTEQLKNLNTLLHSEKDKAELLMIVDLMRNDFGKIAQTGTVSVDSIFKPETYSSLIHLVSEISATLKKDVSLKAIIDALIPGGSITGAPKKRAIEIINNLEDSPRFVYTGSIGYITKDKTDFNIAIRTIYHRNNNYYIHAGGGIVADSSPKDEYNEMLLKAKNLFKAVGIQHE